MINLILYLMVLALLSYAAFLYGREAMLLLGFCGLIFAVLAYSYAAVQLFLMKAELLVPISMVEKGDATELVVRITRKFELPVSKVNCRVICKNTLSGKKKRIRISSRTLAGKRAEISCSVTGKNCGLEEYTLRRIRIYDLTGLFYLTKWCNSKAELQVMPPIYETTVMVTERARTFMGEAEVYDDKRAGEDVSEIFDMRPFREGDKIQSIHWKMSAKTKELIVRENSHPLGCPVVMLLDITKKRKADVPLTVAASISSAFVEQKCAHYIAWYDNVAADVTRIRVDKEEDVYRFLMAFYMETKGCAKKREKQFQKNARISDLYREKYRMESVVEEVLIDCNPELTVGSAAGRKLNGRKLEQELGEVEIVV